MSRPEVRKAGKGDAPYIFILIGKSIGEGDFLLPRKEEEIAELIKEGRFFVAVGEGNVVGCASLEEYNGLAELRSLVVEKEWKGKGIGTELIKSVEQLAGEKYGLVYTFADEGLVEYYKGQGFKDRGKFIRDGKALKINSEISRKLERYCLDCDRYRSGLCNEHLMHKQLS